jgi:hypothetical protein
VEAFLAIVRESDCRSDESKASRACKDEKLGQLHRQNPYFELATFLPLHAWDPSLPGPLSQRVPVEYFVCQEILF